MDKRWRYLIYPLVAGVGGTAAIFAAGALIVLILWAEVWFFKALGLSDDFAILAVILMTLLGGLGLLRAHAVNADEDSG